MRVLLASIILVMLTACTQSPTKNTQVVDDRPGLAFDMASPHAESYELMVDGISYGRVGQYLSGENRLRLVDGTHVVELVRDGQILFSKKIYLGAGSNQILKVGNYE